MTEEQSTPSTSKKPLILNLGCGSNKIEGTVNIDGFPGCDPDLALDFSEHPLPYEDSSVDKIYFFHCIEHIIEAKHGFVIRECWRVLKDGGQIIITYPEFLRVAENYAKNYQGKRDFWRATIYGRQSHPGDFHVSLMDTPFFIDFLRQVGFAKVTSKPEPHEPYNTIVCATKGLAPSTYEKVLSNAIFNK